MNLMKKNIHMDRVGLTVTTQIALDDDINVTDTKPDINAILLSKGWNKSDEVRCSENHIHVRGSVYFSVLYRSDDNEGNLYLMEGSLPYDEVINVDGAQPADTPYLTYTLEDLTPEIVNSRKLRIRALLTIHAECETLYDEEFIVEATGENRMEYKTDSIEMLSVNTCKKDVLRMKEEIELPKNNPNIGSLVWQEVHFGEPEFKCLEGSLSVKGELDCFFLYQSDGSGETLQLYETTLPFTRNMECSGCTEIMIPCIDYEVIQNHVEVRPDFDGEERVFSVDLSVELNIKLYEEVKQPVITDIYSTVSELCPEYGSADVKRLLIRNNAKTRITEHVKINEDSPRILRLAYYSGNAVITSTSVTEDGVLVEGYIALQILYITGNDGHPYAAEYTEIPFSHLLEAPEIDDSSVYNVRAIVEQLNLNLIDSEEIDVKIILSFSLFAFHYEAIPIITDIKEGDRDSKLLAGSLASLPGITIYFVKEGDTLWQIGKHYLVAQNRLKEMNSLTSDVIKPGDRLVVVKSQI